MTTKKSKYQCKWCLVETDDPLYFSAFCNPGNVHHWVKIEEGMSGYYYCIKCNLASGTLLSPLDTGSLSRTMPRHSDNSPHEWKWVDWRSTNPITNPPHYTKTKIQPIDVIDDWELGFRLGNVIKYIARYQHKDGIQDLKKAREYLDREIEKMERES